MSKKIKRYNQFVKEDLENEIEDNVEEIENEEPVGDFYDDTYRGGKSSTTFDFEDEDDDFEDDDLSIRDEDDIINDEDDEFQRDDEDEWENREDDDLNNEPTEEEEEEEEQGIDYVERLKELADALGTTAVNGKIEYEGKTIIYPSETNMYHVDKKKFKTVDEVLAYLGKGENTELDELEDTTEDDEISNEYNVGESKSYKNRYSKKK